MISQTTEYALKAIVCLAAEQGQNLNVQEIASRTKAPANYLSKILQQLAKAKIVTSRRGLQGGFSLLMAPEKLTVLDVINAVSPFKRFNDCPIGLKHGELDLCPLSLCLNEATGLVEHHLKGLTIKDLII